MCALAVPRVYLTPRTRRGVDCSDPPRKEAKPTTSLPFEVPFGDPIRRPECEGLTGVCRIHAADPVR